MSNSSVYHWGELEAQARAGLTKRASAISQLVQPLLPDGADNFLSYQNLLAVGAQGDDGRLWASLFVGPRGFISAPDDESVQVLAQLAADDPVEPMTRRQGKLGLLAIDLETRIRLRINGEATPLPGGLRLAIEQSFPNCPKYIQKRHVVSLAETRGREAGPADGMRVAALTDEMSELVAHADTFFVASASETGDPDVSHRGGNPGFVDLMSRTRLRWPDYVGNNMLMTLGNITENPHAALLFVDWATGTALQLTGRAKVNWPEGLGPTATGQRSVEFELDEAIYRPEALLTNWSAPTLSRFNPPLPV
ncbi:putative pyridoxine 5'-phosphate oxidase superfamily flavin-nucleotide-binding protein [Micromonospora vinacea]|uniref:Pyridoxine 5'-phosphate oxidase superfamily flavin-nucleotide-binding protein n=1 Tax=Micromonospora vinacea TaxID=709878 RepID=A0ABS0KBI9_9ACTN|nr:pyridoxamine 5'-phosphate oxidase family protein [Micromonospora vinacea]MBG6106008.1 putative pyridoxine 5'-phosphate oxidase superfamily flavin-nucleotide-binding protein [Micromonospora vinacea]